MRQQLVDTLQGPYDVAVIGGGINGSGIAEALTYAGYSVALLEQNDFGSGTSSRATRLIHGGLRYLQHGELSLVYESLGERETLLRLFPHLVKPIELLLPIYEGGQLPRWKAQAGLALYDILSLGKSLPRHRRLSADQAAKLEPLLNPQGLQNAFLFHDAQVELAERLNVEVALSAARGGASVANYACVSALQKSTGGPEGGGFRLTVQDRLTGASVEVEADIVINAAGPWVDAVLALTGKGLSKRIGGTRGSHVVVRRDGLLLDRAIYAPAQTDGRPFFVIPWLSMLLLGTTDILETTNDTAPVATAAEIAYLLGEANGVLNANLTYGDIVYTYSGLRPLPASDGQREEAITRRHFLVDHASEGLPNLYSLVGGKLTTYRSVGRGAVKEVKKRLGERWPHSPSPSAAGAGVPRSFQGTWGRRASEVYARYNDRPELLEPICAHCPEPRAAIVEAARNEMATSLADLFLRRTTVGLRHCQGLEVVEAACDLLAAELGWNEAWRHGEPDRYREDLALVHPSPERPAQGRDTPAPLSIGSVAD